MRFCSRHIFVFALLALLAWTGASAQTDTQLTQYWAVQNYFNPAATGTTDFINIRGGTRMQWVGIENAPKSFIVGADSPFKLFGKRFGAGILVNQESIGLFNNLNIGAQISYKLKIFKGVLSIGAQIGYAEQAFKGSEAVLPDGTGEEDSEDGTDPQTRADEIPDEGGSGTGSDSGVPTSDVKGSAMDLGFGIHFTHKYFWASLSGTHLLEPTVSMNADGTGEKSYEGKLSRMLYFMAGSNIPIKNTLFEVQPSVLLRTDFDMFQADITARVRFKKMFSAGIGYRTNDAVSVMLGAEFKNFFIGYSYDYSTSALSKVSNGSHEIFVSYKVKLNLGEKNKNKHKSIRIM